MSEVQNKWSTLKLNDDIWAKLIYFEHNRRLAKAYVSAPALTVDGSANGLDGFRIGLSGIENSYRSLDSMASLRSIGLGVKLKIDTQGNILIRKLAPKGQQQQVPLDNGASVYIKDWPSALGSRLLAKQDSGHHFDLFTSNWRELKQTDVSYKLFDMRQFRRQLSRLAEGQQVDWRQCVSVISFVRQPAPNANRLLLEDPCWLMLINIIAIDMIKSTLDATRRPSLGLQSSLLPNKPSAHPKAAASNKPQMGAGSNQLAADRLKRMRQDQTLASTRRQYHSIQHLDSTIDEPSCEDDAQLDEDKLMLNTPLNSIYTTFNGKLTNGAARQASGGKRLSVSRGSNQSPAAHYNSSSVDLRPNQSAPTRPTGNQQRQQPTFDYLDRHNPSYGSQSLFFAADQQHEVSREINRPVDRRVARPLPSHRSLSLSTCDLSSGSQSTGTRWSRRLELRAMRSAIRMNFDTCLSEDENQSDQREDYYLTLGGQRSAEQPAEEMGQEEEPVLVAGSSSELRLPVEAQSPDSMGIDHHRCSANEGLRHDAKQQEVAEELTQDHDENLEQNPKQATGEPNNKAASSAGSSSSSSGCGADNDYFMSQSSSSMSSSSASNERDLFSQQASSSGIAHSTGGSSTSDEGCPNDEKPPHGDKPQQQEPTSDKRLAEQEQKNGSASKQQQQLSRRQVRASHVKGMAPKASCCCELRVSSVCGRSSPIALVHEPRKDYSSCHCCCGCFSTIDEPDCGCPATGSSKLCSGLKANPLLANRIFGGSQANLQQTTLPAPNKQRIRRQAAAKTLAKLEREFNKISSNPISDSPAIERNADQSTDTLSKISTLSSMVTTDTKENQTGSRSGWLVGKHCSKMLSRFMLQSTQNKLKQTDLGANSQSDSKSRSKVGTKVRLSRSALDLS